MLACRGGGGGLCGPLKYILAPALLLNIVSVISGVSWCVNRIPPPPPPTALPNLYKEPRVLKNIISIVPFLCSRYSCKVS
jgi:hypothetical protein